jgi:hypothetical protein
MYETATANLPYGYGSSESWELYPEHAEYAALLEELLEKRELYPEDSYYAALLEELLSQLAPRP